MKVLLRGYFDSNFGDDYMMKIIVRSLSDVDFVIEEDNRFTAFLLKEENVSLKKACDVNLPVLIVTGSGFMINSPKALESEIKWFIKRKNIGDWCFGCNIEPFDSRLKEFLIKQKLKKFKLIVTRDKKSFEWLKKNCKRTKVYLLPDIVFGIPDSWLATCEKPDKLGISVMHRQGDSIDCDYYRKMALAADCWVESTGKGVYLVAFDTGLEDDGFACRCVKNLMKHADAAEIICHTEDTVIKAFARCEKVIGARFHSAILAIRMDVDFYPVIVRDKMRNLIQELNYPQRGCDIDKINSEELIEFVKRNKSGYRRSNEIVRSSRMYAHIFKTECSERT